MYTCAYVHHSQVWRPEDNLWKSLLSFLQTQVLKTEVRSQDMAASVFTCRDSPSADSQHKFFKYQYMVHKLHWNQS